MLFPGSVIPHHLTSRELRRCVAPSPAGVFSDGRFKVVSGSLDVRLGRPDGLCLPRDHKVSDTDTLWFPAHIDNWGLGKNGPTRTRTWNQGIRVIREFLPGADYLFARSLRWWGAGRSSLSSRALKPSGSLCTFRRCTDGLAQDCHRPNR